MYKPTRRTSSCVCAGEHCFVTSSTYLCHPIRSPQVLSGFIVFNRRRSVDIEVWQREIAKHPSLLPSPDWAQLEVWEGSMDLPAARGRYWPFAVLSNPSDTRGYRFFYPHLLVASHLALKAYMWYIPMATLVQTFTLTTPGDPIIHYVEISDDHVFSCLLSGLVAYSCQTDALAFEAPRYPTYSTRLHHELRGWEEHYRGLS